MDVFFIQRKVNLFQVSVKLVPITSCLRDAEGQCQCIFKSINVLKMFLKTYNFFAF